MSVAKSRVPRLVQWFTLLVAAAALLWFLTWSGIVETRPAIHAGVTLYILTVYLYSQRYPNFLLAARMELARQRYQKSGLGDVDLNPIVERLRELMESEKLYAIEDLTLAQLAGEVELRSQQLSELLNSRMNRSFSAFVNEYRVREACRLLLEEPHRSVLAIGMEVGFSSNSAFYKAFRTFNRVSPARYRKQNYT